MEAVPFARLDPGLPPYTGGVRPMLSRAICPSTIVEARLNGRLVVFAGSGVSVPTALPNWERLVQNIVRESTATELRDQRLQAAQALYVRSKDVVYVKLICAIIKDVIGPEVFQNRILESLEPKEAQRAARYHSLLLNLRPAAIVTTNYDHCFEICTLEAGDQWRIQLVETLTADGMFALAPKTIYHLHGAIDPAASMILGLGDYTRLYRRSAPALAFLRHLFTQYSVLFVGCSMRDEEILGELLDSPLRTRHHALALEGTDEASVFECLQIPITSYDVIRAEDGTIENYYGLEHVLSDWVQDINNRPNVGPRRAM